MDYSGKRPLLTDPRSGKTRPVELFVTVLSVSHFVYAEATLTQRLEAVCSSVVRCFQALGGVPRSLVPDNMTTVVGSPNPKDVTKINETFQQLADHYLAGAVGEGSRGDGGTLRLPSDCRYAFARDYWRQMVSYR